MTMNQNTNHSLARTSDVVSVEEIAEKVAQRVVQKLLEQQQTYLRDPNLLLKQLDISKVIELANGLKSLFSSNDGNSRRRNR